MIADTRVKAKTQAERWRETQGIAASIANPRTASIRSKLDAAVAERAAAEAAAVAHRATDPVECALRVLRQRGHRAWSSAIDGGPEGTWFVSGKGRIDGDAVIAFAATKTGGGDRTAAERVEEAMGIADRAEADRLKARGTTKPRVLDHLAQVRDAAGSWSLLGAHGAGIVDPRQFQGRPFAALGQAARSALRRNRVRAARRPARPGDPAGAAGDDAAGPGRARRAVAGDRPRRDGAARRGRGSGRRRRGRRRPARRPQLRPVRGCWRHARAGGGHRRRGARRGRAAFAAEPDGRRARDRVGRQRDRRRTRGCRHDAPCARAEGIGDQRARRHAGDHHRGRGAGEGRTRRPARGDRGEEDGRPRRARPRRRAAGGGRVMLRRWLPRVRLFAFTLCEREGEVEGRTLELRVGGLLVNVAVGRENWR